MAERRIRIKHTRPYTSVYNSVIRDERLSLKTLGLFVIMQSFPEDWEYSVSGLSARCRIGRDAVRKCLRELEDVGYLIREQGHQDSGKFACNTYVLQDEAPAHATPSTEKPSTEKPSTEKPSTVKPSTVKPSTVKPSTVKPSTEKPLTENRTQVKKHLSKETSSNPPTPQKGVDTWVLFERFWAAYPRKQYKDRARKAWAKLEPDVELCRRMSAALDRFKLSHQWTKEDGAYIPHPATWLNGRCWEDEPGPLGKPPAPASPRPARQEGYGWQ